jgi:hypothetical protein
LFLCNKAYRGVFSLSLITGNELSVIKKKERGGVEGRGGGKEKERERPFAVKEGALYPNHVRTCE